MSANIVELPAVSPRIVEVNSADFEAILDLRHRALDEPAGFTERQPAYIEDFAENSVHLALVTLRQQRVVAACRLTLLRKTAHLGRCGVEPELQGRGLGAKLLKRAEEMAYYREMDYMALTARPAATGFYEKAGYEYTGQLTVEAGVEYPHMQKTLYNVGTLEERVLNRYNKSKWQNAITTKS